MLNRDIYQRNPVNNKLQNEGVATVNDDSSSSALKVLRYELETFVCDGQYEKGLVKIIETFLKNHDESSQPGVWVSGFYGSGKSHLIKMLRALWIDTGFPDGATARGLVNIPDSVTDLLTELNTQSKRYGGLWASSGTLGSGAGNSVRLALLRILFKSNGLPDTYPVAMFALWLKEEGIYDQVREAVENKGIKWESEILKLWVSDLIHESLVALRPNYFSSLNSCADTLTNMYPNVQDISNDDLIRAINKTLRRDGKFPLTLVVLDEVQQYIGESSERSINVQEMVESLCKNFEGKLLFIGTGQTAVTGTANLARLQGRFTVRIELSDADVDTVIRKVILAKTPESTPEIDRVMQKNIGEISRHLSTSSLRHKQDDVNYFPSDYPILPIRRRFWENTLRILDQTGTDSQLRNQLSLAHKVIQTNLDKEIGNVVPADYLYFDSAVKLQQASVLPRKVYEKTMTWIEGNDDEKLLARACGLVFLINKLSGNKDIGITATMDTIADLLIEDLDAGSGSLRGKLPQLLDSCEILMKVGNEYRIQTTESVAWNDDFNKYRSQITNQPHRIEGERSDRLRKNIGDLIRKTNLLHGRSKIPRDISLTFDSQLPKDNHKKIYLWIRDGWSTDENSVKADARQAGNDSPTIYIFVPKRSADDLRHQIIEFRAASETLFTRDVPSTAEGKEARAAMETRKSMSNNRIESLLGDCLSGIRVLQAGGNEIVGNSLQEIITEGSKNSLIRLYPNFNVADHESWGKVYEKAQQGSPDALKAINYDGEVSNNPVCKMVLSFIAGGKIGNDLRNHFEEPEYGWSRDAVDGALQVLLIAGIIRAQDERGKTVDPRNLERKSIGKTQFRVESATVTTAQRIQVRKIMQMLGINAKQGEEHLLVQDLMNALRELADKSGGDKPLPLEPDTTFLKEIELSSGNEQLLSIYNTRDEIEEKIETWKKISGKIEARWPNWEKLQKLNYHAKEIDGTDIITAQVASIVSHRQLLLEPDPVEPLINSLGQFLREKLNCLFEEFTEHFKEGTRVLKEDDNWNRLDRDQRQEIMFGQQLNESSQPIIEVHSTEEVIRTLDKLPIQAFSDRVAALPIRFGHALIKAAEIMEPKAQFIKLPGRTLKTSEEIDKWVEEIRIKLNDALDKGPVVIQ